TGWRTARLDAVETYMDCPYYEQLQYVGDTRIQAMVSLYNSGDDRLMRNAITQIDYSRMAEGITLSRYPTANAQEIPPFSLWWIGMLNDYWMYRDDPNFVKQFLPGERHVLQFFNKYQQSDGSLKNAPYWEFTDWAEGKGWESGMPPFGSDGSSAALDLQLLWAYQIAARLEDSLGMKAFANEYAKRAALLTETIKRKYWDNKKHLFADTKEKEYFSQHTNTLAILTNVIQGEKAKQLAEKMISDTSLTQATIYFQYYLNQALRKTGFGNLYLDRLQIWKDNLANGLTTWAEISDINAARSDCHAWGASPNIEFFRIVLGIDTDAPGFNKIRIEPHLGNLKVHPVQYLILREKLKLVTALMQMEN
ncbi:MAG: alpha-rhamnosidase, partial [Ginsengibacter sp.]